MGEDAVAVVDRLQAAQLRDVVEIPPVLPAGETLDQRLEVCSVRRVSLEARRQRRQKGRERRDRLRLPETELPPELVDDPACVAPQERFDHVHVHSSGNTGYFRIRNTLRIAISTTAPKTAMM